MKRTERDNLIIRMAATGETKGAIADALGVSVSAVRYILFRDADFIRDREPPVGMKMRTACRIEQFLGIWPSNDDRELIAKRFVEFLRSPDVNNADFRDVEAWLSTENPR